MGTDKVNYNGHIFPDKGYTPIDWSKAKPFDFASDFAQWRKANSKQDKAKPDFQILSAHYNNLLKKEYPEGANVPQSFYKKVYDISNDLGSRNGKVINCDMEDLLAIMFNESKFDSKLVSDNGKYAGLIQIDDTTYNSIFKNSSCNYEQFKKLPRGKQLSFIQEYFSYRIKTAGKGFDKYIDDKNGKISGGALYTLVWRPGDFEKADDKKIAKNVRIKQNTINKINKNLEEINSYMQYFYPNT